MRVTIPPRTIYIIAQIFGATETRNSPHHFNLDGIRRQMKRPDFNLEAMHWHDLGPLWDVHRHQTIRQARLEIGFYRVGRMTIEKLLTMEPMLPLWVLTGDDAHHTVEAAIIPFFKGEGKKRRCVGVIVGRRHFTQWVFDYLVSPRRCTTSARRSSGYLVIDS